ncbi:unnamed protein product [Paramecium octaurelia]|uniref:Tetratricopeptide repeat protein n=1 Tax=Paramecium octaurelia TaxID=43137 RepID=A0A8S1XQI4_PAROT|nr:unnamed protein product [Paramecium octaurelia]
MIQQASLKLKCQEDNHKEEIDFICYYEFCTGFRLNCFDCFKKGIHHTHSEDVKKVNSLIPFIESNNKECDNLIDDLNKCVESLNQSFSQLTKGIRNKYSLVKERLVNMNSYQINDYLNSTVTLNEYKQSILKIIQEQIKKLNHSFDNLYEQLQLSSFNYYQIEDNHFEQAEDLCNQGKKLYLDFNYNEALKYLNSSILINPNNKESLYYKGDCLMIQGKYEDAITWLDKGLAIDPKHVVSLSNKGQCLRGLGKYEDAITWLDKAIAIDLKHVVSLCNKGQCLRMLNKHEDAITWLDKALAIDPKHIVSLSNKGQCLLMIGKYVDAITWLDKALAIDPKHVGSLCNKG